MKKSDFIKYVYEEIIKPKKGIKVEVNVGLEEPETISNPYPNVEKKFEYYKSAYDENMKLLNNPNIQILSVESF